MKAFFIVSLICCGLNAQILKGLKAQGLSVELELLLKHLSNSKDITSEQAAVTVGAASLINEDLSKTPKSNVLFLIKSEIYKSLLNNQHLPRKDEILINETLVKSIESKVEKHAEIYSEFAYWIANSVIEELAPYRSDKFLDKYQTIDRSNLKSRARAFELQRIAKYLSPWLLAFNENSPEDFNKLVSDIAVDTLKGLSKKSFYFREFTSKNSSTTLGPIITIPSITPAVQEQPGLPSASLELKKKNKLNETKKAVDILEKLPEDPSEGIDQLLEKQKGESSEGDGSEKQWTPK